MVNAGDLRQRVELQAPTYTTNSISETVITYITMATVWGAYRPLSGNLYFQAKQANSNVNGEVEIRYRSDVKPTWRLKIGEKILYIVTIINPESRNEKLWIKCTEALD